MYSEICCILPKIIPVKFYSDEIMTIVAIMQIVAYGW